MSHESRSSSSVCKWIIRALITASIKVKTRKNRHTRGEETLWVKSFSIVSSVNILKSHVTTVKTKKTV